MITTTINEHENAACLADDRLHFSAKDMDDGIRGIEEFI